MHAARAAWTAYNERALVPVESLGWDTYEARLFRYHFGTAYYNNTVYSQIERHAAAHKQSAGLYRHTRGIYNPVARLVDLYVAKVYGGGIDDREFQGGSLPIIGGDEQLYTALRHLLRWSNWGTEKSLYVRYGAMLGDVALKVIDDRARGKVRLEVLHPGKLKDVTLDEVGNVKSATIEYERCDDVSSPLQRLGEGQGVRFDGGEVSYTYTEIIDGDSIRTFRDGEPFAYLTDPDGQPVSEWQHGYGFAPLVVAQHKNLGLMWGASAYHNSLRKIDEINDQASNLNDQIRKMVNAIWYFAGVRQADEITAQTEAKDAFPALYGPENSQPFPMVAPLNIADAGRNIEALLAELERDMPELSLHRLRERGGLTEPGVHAAYSDAVDRITEARGNYDSAFVRAAQMALSIGALNRCPGFEAFSPDSYARGDLDFAIADRPVLR